MAIDALLAVVVYLGGGFVLVLMMWSVIEPLIKRLATGIAAGGIVLGIGALILLRDWTLPPLAWVRLLMVVLLVGLAAEAAGKWRGRRDEASP